MYKTQVVHWQNRVRKIKMSIYAKIILCTLLPCIVLGQFSNYPSASETSTSQYEEFADEQVKPSTEAAPSEQMEESPSTEAPASEEDFDLETESSHSTTRTTSDEPVGTTDSSDYVHSTLDSETETDLDDSEHTTDWTDPSQEELSTNAPDVTEAGLSIPITNSPDDPSSVMDFTHKSYGTQVPWYSVSSPSPNPPRQNSVQTQGSNSSDTINGSAWQFQGSFNGSSFSQAGNLSISIPSRNPKPICKNGLKYAKKISEVWRSCELATRLWDVNDISNRKSPCFAKCLMDKMRLISSSDSSIREKEVRKKFQQDGPSRAKVNSLQAMIWEECVLQINRITKGIYSRISSSCDHHATFLTCGLQKMTQNCSLTINPQNLTFMAYNAYPSFAIQILDPPTR